MNRPNPIQVDFINKALSFSELGNLDVNVLECRTINDSINYMKFQIFEYNDYGRYEPVTYDSTLGGATNIYDNDGDIACQIN